MLAVPILQAETHDWFCGRIRLRGLLRHQLLLSITFYVMLATPLSLPLFAAGAVTASLIGIAGLLKAFSWWRTPR